MEDPVKKVQFTLPTTIDLTDLSELSKKINSLYSNCLNDILIPEKDFSKLSDEELVEELRKADDFDKLIFPNSWYSKFNLPPKKANSVKEFIQENAWMKRSQHFYVEKIDIPAKPGGVRPVLPAPEVPQMVIVQNSFSDAPTNQICDGHPQETPE